jgi:hypothetical protein
LQFRVVGLGYLPAAHERTVRSEGFGEAGEAEAKMMPHPRRIEGRDAVPHNSPFRRGEDMPQRLQMSVDEHSLFLPGPRIEKPHLAAALAI